MYCGSSAISLGDGLLTEFSYSSGAWHRLVVDERFGFGAIAAGAGRYDGVSRLYSPSELGLREYTWSGGQWNVYTFPGSAPGPFVMLGDLENSGFPHVYEWASGSGACSFQEWGFTFGTFSKSNLTSVSANLSSGAVGVGRNDGIQRIYGAGVDGSVYEIALVGGVWTSNRTVVIPAVLTAIAVGDGRNDGHQRVYVATQDAHIYELTFQNGTWSRADVGYGGQSMSAVRVGPGRNDSSLHVYAGSDDTHLYEFSYSGTSWQKADLGSGGGAMQGITIGDARGDGVSRVYAANADNSIYEFSYAPAGTNLPPAITSLSNGYLTWTNSQVGAVCDIVWAPDLQAGSAWSDNWSSVSRILVTNKVMKVRVPMFYRVRARTEN